MRVQCDIGNYFHRSNDNLIMKINIILAIRGAMQRNKVENI